MRTLHTPLSTLEPQVVAHANEMFVVLSDPAIYEFENVPPASEAWLSERFARLESRGLADGKERWLNWVIRLANSELAGYVQATLMPNHVAFVAYELASRFWRQGIGSGAVAAMEQELIQHYGVQHFVAVLKSRNFRSRALLMRRGYGPCGLESALQFDPEPDEIVMIKRADRPGTAI